MTCIIKVLIDATNLVEGVNKDAGANEYQVASGWNETLIHTHHHHHKQTKKQTNKQT